MANPTIIKPIQRTIIKATSITTLNARQEATPYIPNVVNFDGTNDYLTRGAGLSGATDGKKGIVSFWSKWGIDDEAFRIVLVGNYPAGGSPGLGLNIYRLSQLSMFVDGYNAAGTRILAIRSTPSYAFQIVDGWRHFMASWDLSLGLAHLYVDGEEALAGSPILTDDTIDYTQSEWVIGAGTDASSKMNCCMSDLYVNFAEYIDLSSSNNRTKFYSATANLSLGINGSLPTTNPPIIFLNGSSSTFQNNAGTGGNFSVAGSLTTCSDSPP